MGIARNKLSGPNDPLDQQLEKAWHEVIGADPSLSAGKKEVVFIESNLTDYRTLIGGVKPGAAVVLLDATKDGLSQIAQWAEVNGGYDAIHLLSHGSEGKLNLGSLTLDSKVAAERAADLAKVGAALSEAGDLLLYGCDLANGTGQDFIALVAQLTGADVAASNDRTGAAALGGNWVLESMIGVIETEALGGGDYQSSLATPITGLKVSVFIDDPEFTPSFVDVTDSVEFDFGTFKIDIDPILFNVNISLSNGNFNLNGTSMYLTFDVSSSNINGFSGFSSFSVDQNPGDTFALEIDANDPTKIHIYDNADNDPDTIWAYVDTDLLAVYTFTPIFTSPNTPPTLDSTKTPVLSVINEDPGAPQDGSTDGSTLVSDLVSLSGGIANVTDTDAAAVTGIAVIGIADGGTLYYSADGTGATWTELTGTVSATSALLLNTDARIYFKPAANLNGTVNDAITFKAWDQTSGSNGATGVDTSSSDAFSTASDTASVSITAQNDAPTVTSDPTVTATEDTVFTFSPSNFNFSDIDSGDTLQSVTIVTTVADGTLWVDSDGNGTRNGSEVEVSDSTTIATADLAKLTFLAAQDANGNGYTSFTYTVSDGTASSAPATMTIDVTAVDNDAPVITSNDGGATASVTANENSTAVTTVVANDPDAGSTLTYSIIGGADQNLFEIDSGTGVLTFKAAPDYENPTDANADNAYEVNVQVSDGALTDSQALTVTVQNVYETPTVTSFTPPNNGSYKAGDILTFTVTFDEAVVVTGTPRLSIIIGISGKYPEYSSGSDGRTITFTYTVEAGDKDADGITINAIDLNGGTIKNGDGTDAVLTLPGGIDSTGVLVDAQAPTLTSSSPLDDANHIGPDTNISLTFSENIEVADGSKVITLWNVTTNSKVEDFTLSNAISSTPNDGQIRISGSVITINPTADLEQDTVYAIKIDADGLKDSAGNSFAGISDVTTLNFTTAGLLTLVTTGDTFNTVAPATGNIADAPNNIQDYLVASDNSDTIIIAQGTHLAGSTLDGGGGTDTVILSANGGATFDFTTAATVLQVEKLTVESTHAAPVTVTLAAGHLSVFGTLTGTGDDVLALSGGGSLASWGLSSLTLGGFQHINISSGTKDQTLSLKQDQIINGATRLITSVTGGSGTDTLILATASGTLDLTASSLSLSSIEAVDVTAGNNLTITIDQALDIAAGAGTADTVQTGLSALDLSSRSISGIEALVATSTTGASFTLAAAQIGTGKIVSVTGGSGTDTLQIDDASVDLTALTLSGIETFKNTLGTGTTSIDQTVINALTSFQGNNGVLQFAGASLDISALATSGVTSLTSTNSTDAAMTMTSAQFAGLSSISAQSGSNSSVTVTGTSLDSSGKTLTNIALLTTSNTSGTDFVGSANSESIVGGAGNDTLDGGAGNDMLTGGAGNDVFRFHGTSAADGTDLITDLTAGDIIRVAGANFTSITSGDGTTTAQNTIHLSVAGGRTRLHIGTDGMDGADVEIVLDGEFTPSDFALSTTDISLATNTAPTITAPGSKTISENAAAVSLGTISIADPNVGDTQTIRLDANNGTFSITASGLTTVAGSSTDSTTVTLSGTVTAVNAALATLSFTPTANHTGDAGLLVSVSDGVATTQYAAIDITVTDVKPLVAAQTFSVAENSAAGTAVGTVIATADTNGLTWSVTGGTGSGLFTIDPATGQIRVATGAVLDFETTNSYSLIVAVDDEDAGTAADATQTITINLTDVNENPTTPDPTTPDPTEPTTPTQPTNPTTPPVIIPPSVPLPDLPTPPPSSTPIREPSPPVVPVTSVATEDGVPVGRATGTDPLTGRSTEQVVVAPVTADRQDVGGTPTSNADIRLGGTTDSPTMVATLPTGVGVQANGPTTLTLGELADAAGGEAQRIGVGDSINSGTIDLAGLTTVLPGSTPVTLRNITLTVADGVTTRPGEPVVISVPTSTDMGGAVSAVVIDGRSLPAGSIIDLRGIDYAIVIGNVFVVGGNGQNVAVGDDGAQFIRLGPDDDTLRGGGGDDTIGSAEGRDLIYGDDGNDSIFGGVGYDRLDGGTGNDTVDGGSGTDAARFHATFQNVTITRLANGDFTVTDNSGNQGTDLLSGVEILRLDDRVLVLDDIAPVRSGHIAVGSFFERQYLAENRDVADAVLAGTVASGLEHWINWGQNEGRVTFAFTTFDLSLFDEAFYLKHNTDVAAAVATDRYTSGLDHFLRHGQAEGRDASALFDTEWYLERNPDVAAAITAGQLTSALQHYSLHGWREGRDPSAWFDSSAYLETHGDVASSGLNPLSHLLEYGQAEQRQIVAADQGLWI